MRVVVERPAAFGFGSVEIFPSVFTRRPWKEGVASDTDICIAKNGGGDLYLFDVTTQEVRLVIHDEDWVTSRSWSSVDEMIEDQFRRELEQLEPDEWPAESVPTLRFAVELVPSALQEETRQAFIESGYL
jgi:hypothetical protein